MTTPIIGAPELVAAQAIPETTVNEIARYLEQGALWFGKIKDRDLATPPGSPADGDAYIVAASPTGAWAGQAGKIAFRVSTAWDFITPTEGMAVYIADEDAAFVYDGSAFVSLTGGTYTDTDAREAIHAAPTVISGTSHTATLANSYGYLSFTNGSAITFTIPPQADVAWADGVTIAWEQAGAGVITITAGAGVTINSRGGLVASAGQFAVGQLKRTALNTWTLIGDVA